MISPYIWAKVVAIRQHLAEEINWYHVKFILRELLAGYKGEILVNDIAAATFYLFDDFEYFKRLWEINKNPKKYSTESVDMLCHCYAYTTERNVAEIDYDRVGEILETLPTNRLVFDEAELEKEPTLKEMYYQHKEVLQKLMQQVAVMKQDDWLYDDIKYSTISLLNEEILNVKIRMTLLISTLITIETYATDKNIDVPTL